jgi:serine/threonine protein kinase
MQSVGNYDLLEKIAEGGMGAIYRARDQRSGTIVAIKIMPPHMAANPVLLKRFEQEYRAASRLDHPNIVRALDYVDNGSSPYLVMELVEGESLGQKIEREGRMQEQEAIRLIAQVAQGLHRAHKLNLIHRDVKPDNILIRNDGQAKLADLGLVKEADTDLNLTKTGRGLGTPHFMAPEQFRNAKGADIRCDVYSLGATLYMMLTGELPFKSSGGPLDAWMKKIQNELVPPRNLVPDLSERVNWAVLRAMSAKPEMRPSSCREFIEDLVGHSTRRVQTVGGAGTTAELWYLVYTEEDGSTRTVKGTTTAIRRSLKDGYLGDAENVRTSRNKVGPFEPLRNFPEFRDLLVAAAPLEMPAVTPSPRLMELTPGRQPVRETPPPPLSTSSTSHKALPAAPVHISMQDEEEESSNMGLIVWTVLAVVAFASAAATFWLVPENWWR